MLNNVCMHREIACMHTERLHACTQRDCMHAHREIACMHTECTAKISRIQILFTFEVLLDEWQPNRHNKRFFTCVHAQEETFGMCVHTQRELAHRDNFGTCMWTMELWNYEWQWRHLAVRNGTMSDSGAISQSKMELLVSWEIYEQSFLRSCSLAELVTFTETGG